MINGSNNAICWTINLINDRMMKSVSALMNELAHKTHYLRELTPQESKKLKNEILNIYKDVASLCDKYGLTYMMSGGSCLGAVRHKGFIPWDDDLDIMMPRKDYDKLIELLNKGMLGEKYEYSYPNATSDSNSVFLKIFRKNSKNVEIFNLATPFPKGIFLDVFAIDAVPKSKLLQKIKGFIANVIQFVSLARLYTEFPNPCLPEFMSMDVDLKKRYRQKIILGKICSFASHAKWVYWFDKLVASSKDNPQWGIPTGRKYYNGEILDKNVFVPVTKGVFEGIEVYLPHDPDCYLKNLYGNYMELPPLEKRERHFVCDLQFPID